MYVSQSHFRGDCIVECNIRECKTQGDRWGIEYDQSLNISINDSIEANSLFSTHLTKRQYKIAFMIVDVLFDEDGTVGNSGNAF